jgi:hypothetical protein
MFPCSTSGLSSLYPWLLGPLLLALRDGLVIGWLRALAVLVRVDFALLALLVLCLDYRLLAPVDDVDNALVALALQSRVLDYAARLLGDAVLALLCPKAPDRGEVYNVAGGANAQDALRLGAEHQAAAAGNADELCCVADEVTFRHGVAGEDALAVAELDLDAAGNGGAEHGELEVLLEAQRQVERDDVDVEALAGLLQRALVGGTHGDEVILLLQLGDAEVGGAVGQEDVAAAQDAQARGRGEGERVGDWRGLNRG